MCLPGGKNDPGETDRGAALREANEEVGLPYGAATAWALQALFSFSRHLNSVSGLVSKTWYY